MTTNGFFKRFRIPVAEPIADSYRAAWAAIGDPGCWWTGAERVSIAAEARAADTCQICRARNAALSPSFEDARHSSTDLLDATTVDAVHRIATDSARLTRSWFDSVVPAALTAEAFVEAVSIVATTVAVDAFVRTLRGPQVPLPAPRTGAPAREVVPTAAGEAWVPLPVNPQTRKPQRAGGPNVALRAVPAQYLPVLRLLRPPRGTVQKSALTNAQLQLVAAVVSSENDCAFCVSTHIVALAKAVGPERRNDVYAIVADDDSAGELVAGGRALARFARAFARGDDQTLSDARGAVIGELGAVAFVTAAHVASCMAAGNLIADATGLSANRMHR